MHTRVKDFLGSVRYASPQFIRGEDFDSSDDVYSIGCTLLEIVTGLLPYHQHERKVTLPSVVLQGPPDIPRTVSELASGLDVLIRGCVHPKRSRRPTLSELADYFETGRLTDYITIERARQHGDDVGVPVLKVDDYDFFVDLGGAKPLSTATCKVIRLGQPLTLPSSGHTQITQRLIGNARMVHVHGSLAQYRFLPTVDSQANVNSVAYGLPHPKIDMVEVGDRVVL